MTDQNPYQPPKEIKPVRIEVNVSNDVAEIPVKRGSLPGLNVELGVRRWLFSASAYRMLSHASLVGLIAPTIELPRVVFGDLRRPEQAESFCYAGCPGDYTSGAGIVDGHTGEVALAFAKRLDGETILITRLGQRNQEPNAPGFPVDHVLDFGTVLWQQ